jgi:hypothetical protein
VGFIATDSTISLFADERCVDTISKVKNLIIKRFLLRTFCAEALFVCKYKQAAVIWERGVAKDLIGRPARDYCSIDMYNWSFLFEANFPFCSANYACYCVLTPSWHHDVAVPSLIMESLMQMVQLLSIHCFLA